MALKKSEKKLLIVLGVVAVIAAIAFYRIYGPDNSEPEIISESVLGEEVSEKETTSTSRSSSSGGGSGGGSGSGGSRSSSSETLKTVTMDEFQKHSRGDDCWVIIDGEVYNITFFIEKYPSQREKGLTEYCGTVGFEAGYLKENTVKESIIENSSKLGQIG